MEDVVYFNELYDLYGDLLTDKQREYFEEYLELSAPEEEKQNISKILERL